MNIHTLHPIGRTMWLWRTLQAGSLLSTPSLALIVCTVFGHGHIYLVMWYFAVAWICISLFSDVDIFSCDFLKDCELNLHLEIDLTPAFFWIFFLMTTPRTYFEGTCFLFAVPGSLWILNAQQHSSSWCYYRKWPQGGSTSSCLMLFLFFFPPRKFLDIFCWNRVDFWCCLFQVYRNLIQLYIDVYSL